MQMADKNVIDAASLDVEMIHLHLCAFATINQKIFIAHLQHLRSRMPAMRRNGGVVAQNGEVKFHHFKKMFANLIFQF